MLTTFYFDKELFEDDAVINISVVGKTIIENWEQYGCLATCKDHQIAIRDALNSTDIKHKLKWVTAFSSSSFKKMTVQLREPIVSEYQKIQDLEAEFQPHGIMTGLIPSELVGGLDSLNHTCKQGNFTEVISPCDFDQSIHFQNSSVVSITDINSGETIDDVWKNRFLNLSKNTKKITIIDRYLALNLLEDNTNGLRSSVERLIQKLASNNQKYSIDIYSACDIPSKSINASDLKSYITELKKKPFYSEPNFTLGNL